MSQTIQTDGTTTIRSHFCLSHFSIHLVFTSPSFHFAVLFSFNRKNTKNKEHWAVFSSKYSLLKRAGTFEKTQSFIIQCYKKTYKTSGFFLNTNKDASFYFFAISVHVGVEEKGNFRLYQRELMFRSGITIKCSPFQAGKKKQASFDENGFFSLSFFGFFLLFYCLFGYPYTQERCIST